jgi:hypothetical protein
VRSSIFPEYTFPEEVKEYGNEMTKDSSMEGIFLKKYTESFVIHK